MKNIQKIILLIILAFYNFGLFANTKSKSVDEVINEKEKFENVIFDYSFDYIAKRNTESKYFRDLNYLSRVPIKVNETVHVKNRNYLGIANILDFRSYAFEAYKDEQKLILDIKDFSLPGKDWLPNNISNNKWCMKYHFDILQSKERETLIEYENWINYYDDEKLQNYVLSKQKSSSTKTWNELCTAIGNPEILITDCCVIIRGFFYYYCSYGFITDKNGNKLKVKWIRGNFENCFIDEFETIKDGHESIIEYYLDGDYLSIYIDGNKIELAKKCDDFDRQWKSLMETNSCDLSNITWPHHADGTSEYEDTIRYPDSLVIEEPEQIEIEEYDNSSELADSSSAPAENLDRPPFPDKKDPDYWKILEKYYPDEYPKLRFEYLQKRTKIINTVVIPCAIVFGIILLVVLVLVIRKKRAK